MLLLFFALTFYTIFVTVFPTLFIHSASASSFSQWGETIIEPLLVFARLPAVVDGDLSLSRLTAAGDEPPVLVPPAPPVLPVAGAGVPLADWGSCNHLTCVAGPYPLSLRAAIRKMMAGFEV